VQTLDDYELDKLGLCSQARQLGGAEVIIDGLRARHDFHSLRRVVAELTVARRDLCRDGDLIRQDVPLRTRHSRATGLHQFRPFLGGERKYSLLSHSKSSFAYP